MGDSREIDYGPADHSLNNICLYGTPKGKCMASFLIFCIHQLLFINSAFEPVEGYILMHYITML